MNKIEECDHRTLMPLLLAKVNRGITQERKKLILVLDLWSLILCINLR